MSAIARTADSGRPENGSQRADMTGMVGALGLEPRTR